MNYSRADNLELLIFSSIFVDVLSQSIVNLDLFLYGLHEVIYHTVIDGITTTLSER